MMNSSQNDSEQDLNLPVIRCVCSRGCLRISHSELGPENSAQLAPPLSWSPSCEGVKIHPGRCPCLRIYLELVFWEGVLWREGRRCGGAPFVLLLGCLVQSLQVHKLNCVVVLAVFLFLPCSGHRFYQCSQESHGKFSGRWVVEMSEENSHD